VQLQMSTHLCPACAHRERGDVLVCQFARRGRPTHADRPRLVDRVPPEQASHQALVRNGRAQCNDVRRVEALARSARRGSRICVLHEFERGLGERRRGAHRDTTLAPQRCLFFWRARQVGKMLTRMASSRRPNGRAAKGVRLMAFVSAGAALYSVARVGVLFFESLSTVHAHRVEDYELIEVCERGEARGSTKMREACLRARADLAAPIVFKAIVYAVSIAFDEFKETVGSPLRAMIVLLFAFSSFAAPLSGWVRAFGHLTASSMRKIDSDHDLHGEDDARITYVSVPEDDILQSPSASRFATVRSCARLAKHVKRKLINKQTDHADALDIEPGETWHAMKIE